MSERVNTNMAVNSSLTIKEKKYLYITRLEHTLVEPLKVLLVMGRRVYVFINSCSTLFCGRYNFKWITKKCKKKTLMCRSLI